QATVAAAGVLAAGQTLASGLIPARVALLTEGVLKAMLIRKIKTLVVACAVLFAGLGGTLISQTGAQRIPPAAQFAEQPAGKKPDDNLKNTLLALDRNMWEAGVRGDWQERIKFLADDLVTISIHGKNGK